MLVLVEILTLVPLVAGLLNQGNCGLNSELERLKNRTSYIVGGELAKEGKWPWVCSVGFWSNKNERRLRDKFLDTDKWDHQCGGTIITHKHVLTAAHCVAHFQNKGIENNTRVRCGDFHLMKNSSQHGFITGVQHFEKHPKFKNKNFDVAILFLKNELPKNPSINPICLKEPDQDEQKNTVAVVVGWGRDLITLDVGKELKSAKLQILETDYCEDQVGHVDARGDVFRTGDFGDDLFCADDPAGGYTGACHGDSGGPIFTFETKNFRFELQGIVQGGEVCGVFGSPDIYTNTSFGDIHSWILDRVSAKVLVLSVVISNVEETEKKCGFDENCVEKGACASFAGKHKTMIAIRDRDSFQFNQLKKELSDAVCNKRRRGVCCPKCGESDQCIARNECDYADDKTDLYLQLKGQRKISEANKVLKELKERVCEKEKRYICCPKAVQGRTTSKQIVPFSLPSSNLPKLGQCGLPTNDASSVTGGDDTRPGEFPFAALLGYVVERKVGGTRGSPGSIKKETKWSCAGTLITNYHVLTAAHCQRATPERKISKLRLGVWKLTGYGGGGGNKREELPAEQDFDITVSGVRAHEGYATVYENGHKNVVNDIAVIKLPRPATLNKGVQIACLPAFAQEFKNYLGISDEVSGLIGSNPTVIGWGKTQAHQLANWNGVGSVIQQKLKLPLLSKAKCMDKNNNFIPRKTQLCAGGVEGEDSCRGDPGGGLFIQESETERDTAWYLIGIMSFGSRECGNGRAVLYTRVTEFIPWIMRNMK